MVVTLEGNPKKKGAQVQVFSRVPTSPLSFSEKLIMSAPTFDYLIFPI